MKKNHLRRMRCHGAFDLLALLMLLGAVCLLLALIGQAQYRGVQEALQQAASSYEKRQLITGLAGLRLPLMIGGLSLTGAGVLGMLWLRFLSPRIERSLRAQQGLRRAGTLLQYAAAICYALLILFPIYWMIISSLKTSQELLLPVPTLWPQQFQWSNYKSVLGRAPFGRYFYNTLVTTFFIMLGELGLGVLAAYGFSKGRFKGRNALFMLVLGALMIPIQVTFVPIYVLISRLGWMNSFPGLIVPNLVSAYFIFMLRQSFLTVDDSYLEAGKMDGMGRIGSVFHVLVPMCKPTVITVGIISAINGWNSYFWPKMITTNDSRRPIAVGVAHLRETFSGMETANYHEVMAGAVMAIIPIVILFLVLQKYIMTGFSKAAMK